ncbi:hypothetical protein BKA61DRAFT_625979 [Leptodontidium sp. MPI-SDFR-AT-0119]|nr:hypothetical protein BKA61DRAFT_625979 [Leptodontidium sp. MPI-SDFR-AT-0119]
MILLIFFTKVTTPLSIIITIQILAECGTGISYISPLLALQSGVLVKDNATATSTFCFIRETFNGSFCRPRRASVGDEVANLFSGKTAAANALLVKGLESSQKVLV